MGVIRGATRSLDYSGCKDDLCAVCVLLCAKLAYKLVGSTWLDP